MNAKLISISGRALFIVYVVSIVAVLLPLDLTSPAWGTRVSTLVVDAASLPLVGLLLMRYAAHLEEESAELEEESAELEEESAELEEELFVPDPISGLRRLAFGGFILMLLLAIGQVVLLSSSFDFLEKQKLAGVTQIDQQYGGFERELNTATDDRISLFYKQSRNSAGLSVSASNPAEQRKVLLNQIGLKKLESFNQINKTYSENRASALRDLLRIVLVSVIYAWAFYGIAKL